MKYGVKLFLISFVFLSLWFSGAVYVTGCSENRAVFNEELMPCKILTQSDAEKILGQPVIQTEDKSEIENNIRKLKCRYIGVSKDPASGRDIGLSFSLEHQYPTAEQAHQVFESIKKENQRDAVLDDLSGVGDEAYVHSVKPNFHLIIARKGKTIIRLKVNKAVEATSLDELKIFAKKVAEQL